MRKQTKIAAMVSAAALLTIGAAMTSFAAGWTMDGEDWIYTDKYGDRVTNEWKKSGNNWYYLGDDGLMVTSTLIRDSGSSGNDIYYVNSGGIKVTNCWIEMPNDDGFTVNDHEPSTVYYYMGTDGKATKASDDYVVKQVKKNNNTTEKAYFIFDTEGHMMTGWVDVRKTKADNTDTDFYRYYLGDDEQGDEAGVARTGWQYLEDPADAYQDPYEDSHWYWFSDTGKCVEPESTRYIDGRYYHFNEDRQMNNGWFEFDPVTSSTITTSPEPYVGRTRSDGRMQTGWVQRTEDGSDDVYWYYLINEKGENNRVLATVPFNRNGAGKAANDTREYAARSINNKIYLFNNHGQMVSGLTSDLDDWELYASDWDIDGDGDAEYDNVAALVYNSNGKVTQQNSGGTNVVALLADETYYFLNNGGNEGQMARNARTAVTIDGETYYYHFQKNGAAATNEIVNGMLYDRDGVRVQSDSGWMSYRPTTPVKYTVNKVPYVLDGDLAVNASGHVKTLAIPKEINTGTDNTKASSSTIRIDGETYTVRWFNTGVKDSKKRPIIKCVVE